MSVRAKFTVQTVEHSVAGAKIKMTPVIDGSPENKVFYRWTPSGSIELSTVNPDAAKQFVPGKSYYVDFTDATEGE